METPSVYVAYVTSPSLKNNTEIVGVYMTKTDAEKKLIYVLQKKGYVFNTVKKNDITIFFKNYDSYQNFLKQNSTTDTQKPNVVFITDDKQYSGFIVQKRIQS